jgi:hypothetical protein
LIFTFISRILSCLFHVSLGVAHNSISGGGIGVLAEAIEAGTLVAFEVWGNPAICGPSLSPDACKVGPVLNFCRSDISWTRVVLILADRGCDW